MQRITSANTSMNSSKVPVVFSLVQGKGGWKRGTRNGDIGGGKFDTATKWLKTKGVQNVIFDPHNRTIKENNKAIELLSGGRADTVTVSNVLNVLSEPCDRTEVLILALDAVRTVGTVYFTVYEGNGSGRGRATRAGWQENRNKESYKADIALFFEDVQQVGKLIIAKKPRKSKGFNYMKRLCVK